MFSHHRKICFVQTRAKSVCDGTVCFRGAIEGRVASQCETPLLKRFPTLVAMDYADRVKLAQASKASISQALLQAYGRIVSANYNHPHEQQHRLTSTLSQARVRNKLNRDPFTWDNSELGRLVDACRRLGTAAWPEIKQGFFRSRAPEELERAWHALHEGRYTNPRTNVTEFFEAELPPTLATVVDTAAPASASPPQPTARKRRRSSQAEKAKASTAAPVVGKRRRRAYGGGAWTPDEEDRLRAEHCAAQHLYNKWAVIAARHRPLRTSASLQQRWWRLKREERLTASPHLPTPAPAPTPKVCAAACETDKARADGTPPVRLGLCFSTCSSWCSVRPTTSACIAHDAVVVQPSAQISAQTSVQSSMQPSVQPSAGGWFEDGASSSSSSDDDAFLGPVTQPLKRHPDAAGTHRGGLDSSVLSRQALYSGTRPLQRVTVL